MRKNIFLIFLVLFIFGCDDINSGGDYNVILPTPSACEYVKMYNFNDVPVGQSKSIGIVYECSQTTTLTAGIAGVTCDEYSASPVIQTVAAGGRGYINVKLSPTFRGSKNVGLVVSSTADLKTYQTLLFGNGVAGTTTDAPTFSENSLDFGKIALNTSNSKIVEIKNNTTIKQFAVYDIQSSSNDFILENRCLKTYYPGETCSLSIRFEPTTSGEKSAKLILMYTNIADFIGTRSVTIDIKGIAE